MRPWLLILLAVPLAAAQSAPGVYPDADPQPGHQFTLLLVFPDDASGDAVLHLGDGREEPVSTAAGELELVVQAPDVPGTYTARLEVPVSEGTRIYEASYRVSGKAPGEDSPTLPLAAAVALLVLAARPLR